MATTLTRPAPTATTGYRGPTAAPVRARLADLDEHPGPIPGVTLLPLLLQALAACDAADQRAEGYANQLGGVAADRDRLEAVVDAQRLAIADLGRQLDQARTLLRAFVPPITEGA